MVIDADGLNVIAKHPDLLEKEKDKDKVILTPHPGEMSRLLNEGVDHIQKDRVSAAKNAAKKYGCMVVLKGHGTVIADPGGKIFINTTGNPGMASGGVGDVLTGMIAAFLGQGIAPFDAAALAVRLHGLAGDLAAKDLGEYGMIASDLVEKIPYAIQKSS
jgi:NAD(P)H-hydrate epimerase